jgi:parallel beta-helix repeat protein
MRRIRTIQALMGAVVVAGGVATFTPAAQAATIPVACSENALVAAVNLANSTSAADTLALAGGCTYRMTSAHGGPNNALPVITTPIEMIGPATVTRSSLLGLILYRIAEVSSTGSLTLTTSVAFTNGSVLGDGGAILNHGAVTLTVSSLSGNHASGNGGGLANPDTPSGTAPAATFTGSSVTGNSAVLSGGGIYNGRRGTLTTTGLPMLISGNTAVVNGGGIAAVNSTATTLTGTTVTSNVGVLGGGVYRLNGTMTTTNSPISANLLNNCVGSSPAVPNCTG